MTDNVNQKEINDVLWRACDTFRGVIDAAQYMDYILVMLFLKYLSDLWTDLKEQLEKKYKGNAKFVVAKMDATSNDAPSGYEAPEAQGYPVIYFAPADKKTAPVKYGGDRSYDDLVKFVETHATVSLKAAKEEL